MFRRGLYIVLGSIYWRLIKGRFNHVERPQRDKITCHVPLFLAAARAMLPIAIGLAWLESQDPEYVV
jgi:hypothetical protein